MNFFPARRWMYEFYVLNEYLFLDYYYYFFFLNVHIRDHNNTEFTSSQYRHLSKL